MKNNRFLSKEMITREQQNFFYHYNSILANPDTILRKIGKNYETYRELKNDPHVWSCIQSRKSGLLALDYYLEENGAKSEVISLLDNYFKTIDLQQLERDILEAPLFGFQPIELVWSFVNDGSGYFVPEKAIPKPQEWFVFDNEGQLRFRTSTNHKGIELPDYKILNVQFEASYINPYGHSLLSKCYWPVTFKNGGIRFWVNFTERYGMPIMVAQYNRGTTSDENQKLLDELAKMTQDAVIVTPMDVNIQLHEAVKTTSVSLFNELIKHCNSEISKVLLSQTLTTELQTGSYAASITHFKIRREVIQSDARLVEQAINKLIQFIVEVNFGLAEKKPKFKIQLPALDEKKD
jgi:phage gp29-like protein